MNDNSTDINDTSSTVECITSNYLQDSSSNLNQATDGSADEEFNVILPDDFNFSEDYNFTVHDGYNSYNLRYYADMPVIVDSKGKEITSNSYQPISSSDKNLNIYKLDYYLNYNNLTGYVPISDGSDSIIYGDSVEDSSLNDSGTSIYLTLNNINQSVDDSGKTDVKISSDNIVGYNNEDDIFKVKLDDVNGKVLSNQLLIFTILDKNYLVFTDSEGTAGIRIKLNPGVYEIRTTFPGNDRYNFKSNLNVILKKNITREKTQISGNNIYMVYKEPRTYRLKLADSKGNPIVNQKVNILINKYTWVYLVKEQDWRYKYLGKFNYTRTTDEEGYAYLDINLSPNFYNITVNFSGNDKYLPATSYNNISVLSYNIGNINYKGESTGQYLISTRTAQKNNKKIVDLAKRLTKDKSTITEKANAIYDYVRYQIKYELYSNTRYGALRCLELKKGNCVDQSHLVVALCRAVGIPARYCHGPNHVWTQILIESQKIWLIADPTTQRAWGFGVWNIYPEYSTYANIGY
ncbi:MAG: transglutaminase family protein [Methanobrevibacter sp.]